MSTNISIQSGTPIVFANTTDHAPTATAKNNLGDRTDQINLTSLAAGSYRQGAKADQGSPRARLWQADAAIEFPTAPTAGGLLLLWLGFSDSSTAGQDNPANLSGSDGSYAGYGSTATDAGEAIDQLLFVGAAAVSADAAIQVVQFGLYVPVGRYAIPVLKNETSLAFDSDAIQMSLRLKPLQDILP